MKGIVLAGGTGSRLWPITIPISKQLLPIHDKPMIFYPISTLMLAGIRDILLITRPEEKELFNRLLGNGSDYGINISYACQEMPRGLAEALIIGESFLDGDDVCLILGDNIFYGQGLGEQLAKISASDHATIFGYKVANPNEYGVVVLDERKRPIDIVEKPKEVISSLAIPGIYFYPNIVCEYAKNLLPSERGELEISDINKTFLVNSNLELILMERGTVWLDTGTFKSLNDASNFVRTIEERQGLKIGCLEEIAYNHGWIGEDKISRLFLRYRKSGYLQSLHGLIPRREDT
jgi:glucose-1-phosphate thymidylyltransferase